MNTMNVERRVTICYDDYSIFENVVVNIPIAVGHTDIYENFGRR